MNESSLILKKLYALQDKEYALFQSRLTPNIKKESFIGVRVPLCRKLAHDLYKNNPEEVVNFFQDLPHNYYDENMLHGLLINEIKDFNQCLQRLEVFLPYIDNWAVCDCLSPACFKTNKTDLLPYIEKWLRSYDEYTVRFGLEMLMSHYLDADFKPEYLHLAAVVSLDKYYVKMMVAWFFATALAKQWAWTIPYLEEKKLNEWIHNKTIQKAKESYRLSDSQKQYLNGLKY